MRRPRRKNMQGDPYWVNSYKLVYRPGHHRARKDGYVLEHILVAEEKIGRPIRRNEHVHHVNFRRGDNRPENLVVLTPSQHIRVHELANWELGWGPNYAKTFVM